MATPLRVLLVEDTEDDEFLILQELRRGGFDLHCERVQTAAALRAALAASSWDVLLADYGIPGFGGVEALAIRNALVPAVPFLLVSGTVGEEVAVEIMKMGACDYVLKQSLRRLVPAIRRELAEAQIRRARRDAEAELLKTQERLQLVLAATKDTIYDWDLPSDRVWFSASMQETFGYPEREIQPARPWWFDRAHPEDRERVRTSEQSTFGAHRPTCHSEYRLQRQDGSWASVLDRRHVLYGPDGAPLRCIGCLSDLTELRKLEAQFHQAQKMETIGQLAGGVAHDFNNMLAGIIGFSDLLLGRLPAEDPSRAWLEEIRKAGQGAAALTRQLLAFSRRQILEPKVLDLNDIVSRMEKMLRRVIGEDIEFVCPLEPHLGAVRADPAKLEQVIMNLAVNARDAMPHGGKLTIETANVELDEAYARAHIAVTPGPYVLIAVSDSGCGMDEKTKAHLFEPFFTTKEVGKGTGLGLATVYGIVKQSGGNIWVYSEPGKGCTFKIYLPRIDGAVVDLLHTAPRTPAPGGSETVLVAEDDNRVRELIREVLEAKGYRVLLARHGAEALELSAAHPQAIHLLVSDVVMPGMSGRDLATHLVALRPEVRVLYLSGYTTNAIVHHGVLDDGMAFLQKPFATEDLARKVREVLDAPRAGPP